MPMDPTFFLEKLSEYFASKGIKQQQMTEMFNDALNATRHYVAHYNGEREIETERILIEKWSTLGAKLAKKHPELKREINEMLDKTFHNKDSLNEDLLIQSIKAKDEAWSGKIIYINCEIPEDVLIDTRQEFGEFLISQTEHNTIEDIVVYTNDILFWEK